MCVSVCVCVCVCVCLRACVRACGCVSSEGVYPWWRATRENGGSSATSFAPWLTYKGDGFRNSSKPSPALSGRALSAYATTKQVKAEPAAPTHGAAEHSAVHTQARRGRRSPPKGGCTTKACSVPSKPSACKTCARQLPHARARACTPHARTRTVGGCVWVRACDAGMGMGEHLLWRFPG